MPLAGTGGQCRSAAAKPGMPGLDRRRGGRAGWRLLLPAAAEAGWTKLTGQAGAVLSGVPHRVVEGAADNGTVYRLQAVAPDAAAANALCGKLKAAGIACQVKYCR
jgi:hypothetical protein